MKIFYWVMGCLVVGMFAPSLLFFIQYVATGDRVAGERARTFWNFTGVFAMLSLNILIWGHLALALFQMWF
jgi:hypothetical protein